MKQTGGCANRKIAQVAAVFDCELTGRQIESTVFIFLFSQQRLHLYRHRWWLCSCLYSAWCLSRCCLCGGSSIDRHHTGQFRVRWEWGDETSRDRTKWNWIRRDRGTHQGEEEEEEGGTGTRELSWYALIWQCSMPLNLFRSRLENVLFDSRQLVHGVGALAAGRSFVTSRQCDCAMTSSCLPSFDLVWCNLVWADLVRVGWVGQSGRIRSFLRVNCGRRR